MEGANGRGNPGKLPITGLDLPLDSAGGTATDPLLPAQNVIEWRELMEGGSSPSLDWTCPRTPLGYSNRPPASLTLPSTSKPH